MVTFQINSHSSIHKSSSQHHRLFIEDISSCEASAGDRVWATCSGAGDHSQPITIHFLGENYEESAVDILRKHSVSETAKFDVNFFNFQLIMFTVPSLKVEAGSELELRFSTSDDNVTTIPFKYLPRIPRSNTQDISLFDNLLEFATSGDTISLLQPFVSQISKQDIEGNTYG